MLVHNNNKIYIQKNCPLVIDLTHRVYCYLLSFQFFFLILCVILHTILVVWGPRAPKHYAFLLHFSHKKNKNVLFFVHCLVTKQYRMHEQKNMKINRESACVYAYAIISLSLKKLTAVEPAEHDFFLSSHSFMSHTNYILYLCNEK